MLELLYNKHCKKFFDASQKCKMEFQTCYKWTLWTLFVANAMMMSIVEGRAHHKVQILFYLLTVNLKKYNKQKRIQHLIKL